MLRIEHFTKTYGTKVAVDDLTLRIAPGEICGFIGHNGAGKTTLIKLLCRLYEPTGGEILLDGVNINEYDYEQYMEMFQENNFDVETFSGEIVESPRMEMEMSPEGRYRYILPNGEYYDATVPNGMVTSNPVRFYPPSEVAAVITKTSEEPEYLKDGKNIYTAAYT